MSQIIKAYMGMFILLSITFAAAGILAAFLTVADAQDIHQNMVDELENSDFYPQVIKECFLLAEHRGYTLEITLYQSDYTSISCKNVEDVPENTDEVLYARVELQFPLRLAFYEFENMESFCAYAR
jgi:hypothetical protein